MRDENMSKRPRRRTRTSRDNKEWGGSILEIRSGGKGCCQREYSLVFCALWASVRPTTVDNEHWLADNPPLDKLKAGWLWPPLSGSTASRSEPVGTRACLGRPPSGFGSQPQL
ncbi:hypothetical protein J3458_021921 [Metarhizium acridum]|uniref:uncharacterized protein n=1 Tax=Metarhizium acridum TaxID=92637 RepID=UPI001C6BF409|nr:hypothetical protein J3458_021921 [Metarhizium acridum]